LFSSRVPKHIPGAPPFFISLLSDTLISGLGAKPLEGKPATFSQKSVTANANTPPPAVRREGDQRLFFEWMLMDERLHYAD